VSQADFFCGKLNGITFPYSSGGIHFVAFFAKLLGTKNSMIFAINHPTCKNKTGAKKFLILTNLYRCLQAVSPEDIRRLRVMACSIKGNVKENISPSTGAGKHFLGFQPPSP
jgi:hypothetical protein